MFRREKGEGRREKGRGRKEKGERRKKKGAVNDEKNLIGMTTENSYILSFTAASLRLNEMVKVAMAASKLSSPDLRLLKDSGIAFTSVKNRTTDREFREIRKRIETLTAEQKDVLSHGDLISQKQIGFLAVCKTYNFIRDFTIGVLRDKVLFFNYSINDADFILFINNKTNEHPELEKFSESTLKKAKQVMLRIFEQVGIINNIADKEIRPQIVQPDVVRAIVRDDPAWLKIFLLSDMDIKHAK